MIPVKLTTSKGASLLRAARSTRRQISRSGAARCLLSALLVCDPAFARLFTPLHPQLGRYEVCTTRDPIETVIAASDPDATNGAVEDADPIEAFGGAGSYDRTALALLFGGRRVKLSRGWSARGAVFESRTLISPYPNASLTRIESGTMIIRWICEQRPTLVPGPRSLVLGPWSVKD